MGHEGESAVRDEHPWVDGLGRRAGLPPALDTPGDGGVPVPTPRRQSALVAAQIFAANRLILLVISLLTASLFYDVRGRDHSLLGLWHRWDVSWYIRVADHGYHWYAPPIQSDLAFFPLYPLCMHILTLLSPLSAYGAGLLLANLGFAASLYLLHRLALLDFDRAAADRAVSYLGFFPTSLFFFTAYSEALYLACCLGCIYALRLRRWWLAGLCGMAAALTRQLGLLLAIPFAVEYLRFLQEGRDLSWRDYRGLGALALIPAGALLFIAYLQVTLGNGLLFLRAQSAWGRSLAPPWHSVLLGLDRALHPVTRILPPTRGATQTLAILDLSFLLLVLMLVGFGARRLSRSYTLYAVGILLAILVNPATDRHQPLVLLSFSRFALTLFPIYLALGLAGRNRTVDRLLPPLFISLLALFTIIFVRYRWIA